MNETNRRDGALGACKLKQKAVVGEERIQWLQEWLLVFCSAGEVLLLMKQYSCFQVGPEFFLMFDEPEKEHHVPQKTELWILSLVMNKCTKLYKRNISNEQDYH